MAEQKPQQSTLPGGQPLDASSVKPTPTQEENDRAARGEHIEEHERDGSPEEPSPEEQTKRAERERHGGERRQERHQTARPAAGSAGYETRQQSPGSKPAA